VSYISKLEELKEHSKLTNGRLGILRRLEYNRPTAFSTSVNSNVDISSHNISSAAEEVFQILPSGLIRQLLANVR
jgi:hypothetical protein